MSNDPIKDWLNTPIPEKLWHYTSISGFQGIVTSKKIFATDLRFLNDRTEFIHAQKIAQDIIDQAEDIDQNGWRLKDNLQHVVSRLFGTGTLSFDKLQVFTSSFSLAEDQLSQWRGYSRGSSGVSIGFNLRSLRPPAESQTLVTFAPCVYAEATKTELISHALYEFARDASSLWKELGDTSGLAKLLSELRQMDPKLTHEEALANLQKTKTEWFESELRRAGAVVTTNLLRLAGLLKDSSFEEEKEWRLVLPVSSAIVPEQHARQFRAGVTALIPYIAFPLSEPGSNLITDLILGPGASPSPAGIDSTRSFLMSQGIGVEPRESRVPFRPI